MSSYSTRSWYHPAIGDEPCAEGLIQHRSLASSLHPRSLDPSLERRSAALSFFSHLHRSGCLHTQRGRTTTLYQQGGPRRGGHPSLLQHPVLLLGLSRRGSHPMH
ncbi:hypothetical protein DPEC_G00043590 [Dallia pectoralis]|uniref:Uncharacterized protein n=1 Tax=Dallia pectoralis TaxID=75939 RepID=A0ACC2H9A5_DALPE|nr:hypothetical protein DPEC_G00043590 [Dallia pectoralis]